MSMTRVGGMVHIVMGPALLGSFRGSGVEREGEGKKIISWSWLSSFLEWIFFFNIHERLSGSK